MRGHAIKFPTFDQQGYFSHCLFAAQLCKSRVILDNVRLKGEQVSFVNSRENVKYTLVHLRVSAQPFKAVKEPSRMHAINKKPIVCILFLVHTQVTAIGQCFNRRLQSSQKVRTLEMSVSVVTREVNGSIMTHQRTELQKSTDIASDGKKVTIEPYLSVSCNGRIVCIAFKEQKALDGKLESSVCKTSCSHIAKSQLKSLLLKRQMFTKSNGTFEETILLFKIDDKAPVCSFCIGNECSEGKAKPKQCNRGDKCYYMTIKDHPDEPKGFPTMGCVSDILFQRLEPARCFEGCSYDVKYGSWKRYVCTYCCSSDLCSKEIRIKKEIEEKKQRCFKSSPAPSLVKKSSLHWPGICAVILVCAIHLA